MQVTGIAPIGVSSSPNQMDKTSCASGESFRGDGSRGTLSLLLDSLALEPIAARLDERSVGAGVLTAYCSYRDHPPLFERRS